VLATSVRTLDSIRCRPATGATGRVALLRAAKDGFPMVDTRTTTIPLMESPCASFRKRSGPFQAGSRRFGFDASCRSNPLDPSQDTKTRNRGFHVQLTEQERGKLWNDLFSRLPSPAPIANERTRELRDHCVRRKPEWPRSVGVATTASPVGRPPFTLDGWPIPCAARGGFTMIHPYRSGTRDAGAPRRRTPTRVRVTCTSPPACAARSTRRAIPDQFPVELRWTARRFSLRERLRSRRRKRHSGNDRIGNDYQAARPDAGRHA